MPIPEGFDYDMWLGPTPWYPYTEKRCHFWFRYILEYSGGEVTDRGAHVIDIGQLGNGTDDTGPIEIEGKGKFLRNGIYDIAEDYHFEFLYANGVRMICSTNQPAASSSREPTAGCSCTFTAATSKPVRPPS